MEDNSGGFRADVFEVSDAAEADRRTDTTGPIDPKILGKRVFTQSCVVCHQITGLGVPGQFPPLAGSEWVTGGDWHGDNHLVAILLKGLQGPVQVKGMTFNNAMPTWRQLSDEQIAAVLNYIRSEWGNAAAPISSDYVKAIREQTAGRVEPWTAKTLQTMPPEKVPPLPAPGPSPTPAPALPADLSKRGVSKR
jgi:mono/diheme cytochrome c family protein